MAGFRSVKMLLCTAVLFAAMLVTHTSAEDGAETGPCSVEGEVRDSEGHCCSPSLIDGDGEEKVCFKTPSSGSISTAFTLVGSFTFTISLIFAMNWNDEDMRGYAYTVISSTISIFSAVMMFQCFNGLLEDQVIERFELEGWWALLVDLLHSIFWYAIMQIVIAVVSRALKPEQEREELLNKKKEEVEQMKEEVEVGCQCYGIVLAHLTGFASINVWTGLQSQAPFNSSPLMALVPWLASIIGTLLLQRITDACRERIIMGDDKKDFFEDKWDDMCEEAENDVASLTASVLIVNALRMGINGMATGGEGCLPNQEQKDEGEKCEGLEELPSEGGRTFQQVIMLFLAGVLFAVVLFLVKLLEAKFFPEEEKENEEEKEGEEEEEGEEEKPLLDQVVERLVDSSVMTLSMCFAWCMFHANIQLMELLSPGFFGSEDNACSLAVVIGLEVTYISWMIMLILDKIKDLDESWTPKAVDDSIEAVISGLALLIGFAWEQCFDTSVDSLAQSFRLTQGKHAPAMAKLVIGSLCCIVVFIAWKWYILDYWVKQGWKYHVVMLRSRQDLHTAAKKLEEANQEKGSDNKDMDISHVVKILEKDSAHAGYTALPGEPENAATEKNKVLLEKLRIAEEEKAKLQNLLSTHMESMLTSFKSMNDTVTRIEME